MIPKKMKTVLVTNDDGYISSGYLPLLQILSKTYHVIPVAPRVKKSWIGKAVTAYHDLEIQTITYEGFDIHTLNGTPADCVQIGCYHLLDSFPDYVISGINLGTNIGIARLLSSGTVGAAMEAALASIPSLAISLSIPPEIRTHHNWYHSESYTFFRGPADITLKLSSMIFECPIDKQFFSLNIPFNATIETPIDVTIPFDASYGSLFEITEQRLQHRVPPVQYQHMQKGTDIYTLYHDRVSLTPLNLSMVSLEQVQIVKEYMQKQWRI